MLGELVVKVGGNVAYEGDGNADDGLRLEWRERAEELHWAVGVGSE